MKGQRNKKFNTIIIHSLFDEIMILKSPKKGLENYTRDELYLIRKQKLKNEILSGKKLLKNIEPLKIADEFIHNIFKLMENGFFKRNSNLNQEEIQKMIRNSLLISKKIEGLRKRGRILLQS